MARIIKNKIPKKIIPEITIERVLFDKHGDLTALDVHNETNGFAYFLEVVSCHYHGYNKRVDEDKIKS